MCGSERDARRAVENAINSSSDGFEDWWVLNSIEVRGPKGNTDVDVLVGVPNIGLLIVEVKGWTSFDVDDQGRWTYLGKGGRPVDAGDGPYSQAHRQEYLLLELLTSLRNQGVLSKGPLPKIGSRVLFGNLDSHTQGLTELQRVETLFRDTFCPAGHATQESGRELLNRLRQALATRAKPNRDMENSKERLNEVRRALSPCCSVKGLASFVNASQIRMDELTEGALGELAAWYDGSKLYVEGAAGTGKTCFALKLAVERSQRTGRQALYICFSKRLAEEIRDTPWIREENVRVGTPEDLLEQLGDLGLLSEFEQGEQQAAEAARQAFELMGITPTESFPRAYLESSDFSDALINAFIDSEHDFCALVVDEAQDLPEELLRALSVIVGPDDLFAVFADPRQTTRRERSGLPWARPLFMDDAEQRVLKRNYRNGDRIIDHVEKEFEIGYGLPPLGASPAEVVIEEYRVASDVTESVRMVVAGLKQGGLEPTILTAGVHVQSLADLQDLGTEVADVDDFKGLERKCVVLALGPDVNPLDPNREDLYVGLTRATTHLTVVRPQR